MDNELKKNGAKASRGPGDVSRDKGHAADQTFRATKAPSNEGTGKSGSDLKDKASEALDGVKDKARRLQEDAGDKYEKVSTWAADRYDDTIRRAEQMRDQSASEFDRLRRNAEDLVTHNPVMIGVAGLAAGLLLGALLPRTQRENETFGRLSDDFREQGKRYALDLVKEGRDRVVDAFETGIQGGADAPHPNN